ncbi:MAG: hypothetical protein VKP72_01905 [bacterium]|nr:hypothetical protein [bacterium]
MPSLIATIISLFSPLAHQPVLLLILFVVVVSGIWTLIQTQAHSSALRGRYEKALSLLSAIPVHADASAKLAAVRQALSGDAELKKRFEHFAATLSERDEDQFTTLEPQVFFNESVLVEHPLDHEFLKHVPGMLTAGGIIGTFAGLIFGLSAMNDGRPLQVAILALLDEVSSAFLCSFLAVLLAVSVTWVERRNITKLNRLVSDIQDELSRLFHRSVAERTLDQMVVTMREQTEILKHTLDDLRSGVVDAVQSIPTEQERQMASLTAALTAQQQNLIATFSTTVTEALQPTLQSLSNTMVRIAEAQTASQEASLKGLIESFGEMLDQKTGTQLEQAASTIQEVGNDMKLAIGALKSFPEDFSNRQTQFIKDLQAAREADGEAAKKREESLSIHLEAIANRLNDAASASAGQVASGLGKEIATLGTELRTLVSEARDQQKTSLTELMTSLERTSEQASKDSTSLVQALQTNQANLITALEEASSNREERTKTLLEELATTLKNSTSELVEATRDLITQVDSQEARIRAEIDKFATAIAQGHQAWVLQQNGLLEGQQQLLTNHGKLLENFDTRVANHASVADSLTESARSFGQSSQSLSDTVTGFQGVSSSMQSVSSNIATQVTQLAQTVVTTRDLAQSLSNQIREHGTFLANLDRQVEQLFGTTAKGVGDLGAQLDRYLAQYNEKTGAQLGKYLAEIETKLGQAVSRLGSSIGDLDENLDSLNEVLAIGSRKGSR